PQPDKGVDPTLIGTVERPDGTMQVSYGGWPLYTFVRDENPGDTNGQGVEGFGGERYMVNPDGEPVEEEGQAAAGQAAGVAGGQQGQPAGEEQEQPAQDAGQGEATGAQQGQQEQEGQQPDQPEQPEQQEQQDQPGQQSQEGGAVQGG